MKSRARSGDGDDGWEEVVRGAGGGGYGEESEMVVGVSESAGMVDGGEMMGGK